MSDPPTWPRNAAREVLWALESCNAIRRRILRHCKKLGAVKGALPVKGLIEVTLVKPLLLI